jgi:hypothetical protein
MWCNNDLLITHGATTDEKEMHQPIFQALDHIRQSACEVSLITMETSCPSTCGGPACTYMCIRPNIAQTHKPKPELDESVGNHCSSHTAPNFPSHLHVQQLFPSRLHRDDTAYVSRSQNRHAHIIHTCRDMQTASMS